MRPAAGLRAAAAAFRAAHLPGAYVGVHFRAGRVWNKGRLERGELVRLAHPPHVVEALIRYRPVPRCRTPPHPPTKTARAG